MSNPIFSCNATDFSFDWCPVLAMDAPLDLWWLFWCETQAWPFVHFMSGFWVMLLLNNFLTAFAVIVLFEIIENTFFVYGAILGNVQKDLIETSADLLFSDPLMGVFGALSALALMTLFGFPSVGPWSIRPFEFAEVYFRLFVHFLLLMWPSFLGVENICRFITVYTINVALMSWILLYWNFVNGDVFFFARKRYVLDIRQLKWRAWLLKRANATPWLRKRFVYTVRDASSGVVRKDVSFAIVAAAVTPLWLTLLLFIVSFIRPWAPYPIQTSAHALVLVALWASMRIACFVPQRFAKLGR